MLGKYRLAFFLQHSGLIRLRVTQCVDTEGPLSLHKHEMHEKCLYTYIYLYIYIYKYISVYFLCTSRMLTECDELGVAGTWHVPQEGIDLSDAVGTTARGQQYANKWPRGYKHIRPDPSRAQSVESAFNWPQKARQNLEGLKAELMEDEKPALLSGRNFRVSSNFSGICSQSRGSRILENNGFGCSFHHVLSSACDLDCVMHSV